MQAAYNSITSASTNQAKARTVFRGTQIQAAFQDDRQSFIVGADHEIILLSTGVLCKNSIFGLYSLGPVRQKTSIPKEVDLIVRPIPAALALTVELILMALLIHNQVNEFAHCSTGPNIELHNLRR